MARKLAIRCLDDCGRLFGGDEAMRKHKRIRGDRLVCQSDLELWDRGWIRDRDFVWHRPVGATAKPGSARVRPPLETTGTLFGPTPTEDRPGKAHALARDTERKAARDITPRTGTARARVLEAIDRRPRTDDEIQHDLTMNPNTQRPRRVELVEGGYIEDSGLRRKTPSNSDAIVWQVTASGRLWCLQEAAVSA